jgi:hypothetical protein
LFGRLFLQFQVAALLFHEAIERVLLPDGFALGEPVAEGVFLAAVAFAGDQAALDGAVQPAEQRGRMRLVKTRRPIVKNLRGRIIAY